MFYVKIWDRLCLEEEGAGYVSVRGENIVGKGGVDFQGQATGWQCRQENIS